MSKKNSNAILKKIENLEEIKNTYLSFKNSLKTFKTKSFLVAVSGGPDSLALVALSRLYNYEKKTKFHYVLINHNIRKDSFEEAQKVKKLLLKHQINLIILSNSKKIDSNIQSRARQIRYALLLKYCQKKKINTILTAHNLEDQVETFFIRLSRGSGLTGLSAMKPLSKLNNKMRLFRPLLGTKKIILQKIAKFIFGKFFIDPTNKNKKYLRTKIRNLKKPLSKSGINYDQVIKSINNLASSNAILDKYFNSIIKKISKKSKNEILINYREFKALDKEIKIKIIKVSIKKLKKNYYDPRSKKVENLINNIKSNKFTKATLGGCLFSLKKDKLCLKKEKT